MAQTEHIRDPLFSRFGEGAGRIAESQKQEQSTATRAKLEAEGVVERDTVAAIKPERARDNLLPEEQTHFAESLSGRFKAGKGRIEKKKVEKEKPFFGLLNLGNKEWNSQ